MAIAGTSAAPMYATAYATSVARPAMGSITMPASGMRPDYGVAEPVKPGGGFRGQRRRMNIVAVCMNLFGPWLLFSVLFAVVSFTLRYRHPNYCWLIAGLLGLVVVTSGMMAQRARRQKQAGFETEPSWMAFLFVLSALAWALAMLFGDWNYVSNMLLYYDVETLNSYPSVDPANSQGQELMDAGRIIFTYGSKLDISKSFGFKNKDVYCVAPITNGNETLASYDFWAVGLNCCSGNLADFRCGEYANPQARAGLRVMTDDQRAYYRLAVQQAEATYNIKASHPLLFYWLQDPDLELNSYRDNGFTYYLLGMFGFFAFNLFCVAIAIIMFSRIGYY